MDLTRWRIPLISKPVKKLKTFKVLLIPLANFRNFREVIYVVVFSISLCFGDLILNLQSAIKCA